MTEQEFINATKKVSSRRRHKITHSYGVYDAYKYYRKNKPKEKQYIIKDVTYYKIIRKINNILKEMLIEGNDIKFPCRMGNLELRKSNTGVYFKDGKVMNNYPIDWNTTLKLWYEDKESKEKKALVKKVTDTVFKVYYNKKTANYKNKAVFDFKLNRDIKNKLKLRIQEGKLDAFINNNYYE